MRIYTDDLFNHEYDNDITDDDTNDSEDNGEISIVLTPIELSAALNQKSISEVESTLGSIWRTSADIATIFGGALELIGSGALIITPDPSLATKFAGVLGAALALDNITTAIRDLLSKEPVTTLTESAAKALLMKAGVPPTAAAAMSAAVGLGASASSGFVATALQIRRVKSIENGIIKLAEHEANTINKIGGHTEAKHVGKSEAFLRNRLATEGIPIASSFRTVAEAEAFISLALQADKAGIKAWAKRGVSGSTYRVPLYDTGQVAGYGITSTKGILEDLSKVRVVLRMEKSPANAYYFILTAYLDK